MNTLLISLFVIAIGWGTPPEPPAVPQPDFVKEVNYLAWYDKAVAYADHDNALTQYGVFLYDNPQRPLGRLAPVRDTFCERDLNQVMRVPTHWKPSEKRGLAEWAFNIERRFAHVVKNSNAHHYYATRRRPELELLVDLEAPLVANARYISQMLIVNAWRVEEGDFDPNRLTDALVTSLIMARHLGQGSTLDEQFFAAGERTMVYEQIRRTLNSPFHMAEQWAPVLEAMERYDDVPVTAEFARSLYFREAAALQLLQSFCMHTNDSGRSVLQKTISKEAVDAYVARAYPNKRLQPDGLDELVKSDPVALAKLIHDYYAGMRDILNQPFVLDMRKKVVALERSNVFDHPELDVLITPLGLSVQTAFRVEAQRRLAYLFLKMAIDFKLTGEWPQVLNSLQGPRVATSRIDPYTGKDMLLRFLKPTAIPYSVGPDGKDDGGDEEKDIIYWGRVSHEIQYRQDPAKEAPTN